MDTPKVCVGAIVGAHGVRGQVRIKSFTEVAAHVAAYGPVADESGTRRFTIAVNGEVKGLVIARLDGVNDRNQAEALRGTRLYVPRAKLPATAEDEFLYSDLVGLRAEDETGAVLGTVRGVADFGAGDVLDIKPPQGDSFLVPFTKSAVPVVDVAHGRVVIVPPEYVADEDEDDGIGGSQS